jgi:putative radical SAM enzyme (TIGR03279 family)
MARKESGIVQDVSEGSLAAYLELEPGDRIVAVNGRTLRDELDFRFLTSEEDLTILIRKRNGEEQAFEVDKDPDEPFGVTFVQPIFDRIKECANNCKFCFVRQIPKEMRRTLHVRDDDYRMSFLYGNFISLTNLTEEDWQRLEEQRLSPLRVSVHTTDPALRQELMRNPKAADVMEHLRRLSGMGIRLHAQIVLLKGINDGENLVRTLRDLESLGPNMVSVGVVPAVYTKYRENPPSPPIDPAWAGETLDLIENYASGVRERTGDAWVHAADEFYIVAGREFPPYEYYGEFHQYENGIGIVPEFRNGLPRAKAILEGKALRPGRAIAVTGMISAAEIQNAVRYLGLEDRVSVCPVRNVFYGDTVTVTGLLTGQDIAAAALALMREHPGQYNALMVPGIALFEGKFLDDMKLDDLANVTGLAAIPVEPSPEGLARVIAAGDE